MTEQELELVRIQLRIYAVFVLVRGLYTGLGGIAPNMPAMLMGLFQDLRKVTAQTAIPGIPAGYSDMVTAEFQDALEEYLSDIEKRLKQLQGSR